MKKLLIAALAVVTFGATAQDVNFKSKRGEYMLPEKGDWALGFSTDGVFRYLGNAFNGNVNNAAPTLSYTKDREGSFVGKYFTSDKSAYRVIFNFSSVGTGKKTNSDSADNTIVFTPPVTPPPFVIRDIVNKDETTSNTEFSIGLGKEWRRGKTRLQGFYGADVLLIYNSSSSTESIYDETTTTLTTPARIIKNVIKTDTTFKGGSGFGIGAEGFIGAEYFLFPKIAIGAQYTYGARYVSFAEGNNTVVKDTTDTDTLPVVPADAFKNEIETTVTKTPSGYNRGFTGVGVVSLNLTLHF